MTVPFSVSMATATLCAAPTVVRFPGVQGAAVALTAARDVPAGRARLCREGRSGLALLSFGAVREAAAGAAERLDASLVDMRFVKPLDEDLLVTLCAGHRALVTIEDNVIAGGAGTGVAELLAARGLRVPLLQLGIPDQCSEGSRTSGLMAARLELAGLGDTIERWWLSQSSDPLRAAAGH